MANKTCLRKAQNQLEKHQMGFDGEHIAEATLKKMGYKDITLTRHKHNFDLLTSRDAFEVKTVGIDAIHQMSVKAAQKLKKLTWAKKNGKRAKSMLIVVDGEASVYMKSGVGKFRPKGMKKVGTYKNWQKSVGRGRTERLVEGKAKIRSLKEAEKWATQNRIKFSKGHFTRESWDTIEKELRGVDYKTLTITKDKYFVGDIQALASYGDGHYTLNGDVLKGSLSKFRSYTKREAVERFSAKGVDVSPMKYLLRHEEGHNIFKSDAMGLRYLDKKYERAVFDFFAENGGTPGVKKILGGYSARSMTDVLPEAYASYSVMGERAGEEVVKLLKTVGWLR